MNLLWDKLLVETHVIMAFFHRGLNRHVYYLFPNLREAQRHADKLKTEKLINADSIQIKHIKDLFNVS